VLNKARLKPALKHLTSLLFVLALECHGSASVNAGAQPDPLPDPLLQATRAYLTQGAAAFLPTLFARSLPQQAGRDLVGQGKKFQQMEALFGKYLGLELVCSLQPSDSTRLVYYVMKYQHGPLYGVVTAYTSQGSELITDFKVHTELQQILGPSIVNALRQHR
jgi:hypothetical protein